MKKTKIYALLAATALLSLTTSCIDETFPEGGSATSGQVGSSTSALEAAAKGITPQMVAGYLVYGKQVRESDMGYPQLMIAQTEMLGNMYPGGAEQTGGDWYQLYNTFNGNMNENSYESFLPWFTLYKFIKTANDIIALVDLDDENVNPEAKKIVGSAYAARAYDYYLLTVLFEPKANKYTDCTNVLGLTVPIVTEKTTGEDAKNNPRASHDDMISFILSDLDTAEECLKNGSTNDKHLPDLAVVYGLKAKVYLLDSKFDKAAEFARKAIDNSGATPMTASEWEDPTTAFAKAANSWMWYASYDAENLRNLANLTGWLSSESTWSYGDIAQFCIDRSLYEKIQPTDFRKHVFVDPAKYSYYNYKTSRDRAFIEDGPAYRSLKFRCLGGNTGDYTVGAATDVPIMRVEEMYLIEAEAVAASQGVAKGVELLNKFMTQYRDPAYNCTLTDLREFQLEVLTQMEIEFWGEGNAFPTAKRLQPGVMQNYTGTNAPSNSFKVNCEGMKPNWTLVIPQDEVDANTALQGKNNPNPSQAITYPSPENKYSEPKNK